MKLKIVKIVDRASPDNERLWLKVLQDADMKFYVVFDTTYTGTNAISNLQRHAYWFPSKAVRAGDNVVLYTRKGTNSTQPNSDGTHSHFFYWDMDKTVWNNQGDCAVLFEVVDWTTSAYE
ncbi:MAG: hypothetical protein NTV49_01030 [Kiritimatiellaeota bacterium]|nr:hypothetical protein [Kiritimatiellota bacterium]